MFCPNCGMQNADGSAFCEKCGTKLHSAGMNGRHSKVESCRTCQPVVKSGMLDAVLATLLCCMPLGIVAIVYAARVSTLVDRKSVV